MAKKKAAKKKASPKKSAPKRKPAKKAGPRSQPLPGMEHVRNRKLDNICEAIGEERERMNQAKVEEKGLIQGALQEMRQANVSVYRHSGVELARVPGAEKLRVRLTKEQGDADEGDLEPSDET